ncbi:MAG: DUF4406 domain-containing protein [bacterium]|nr:DUF4406 domain-containing protein [bacterium]
MNVAKTQHNGDNTLKMKKKTKQKRIYLSGKITGLRYEDAKVLFEQAEKELIKKEWTQASIVNPMKIQFCIDCKSWEQIMVEDIKHLLFCDSIYMLRNWGSSRGARIEYAIAKEMKKTIIFQD